MNIAIILAGGCGKRMGSKTPKQFIKVQGRPILSYTIERFQNHAQVDAIEVVCRKGYEEEIVKMCEESKFDKVKWLAEGGKEFQDSVINGLRNLKSQIAENDQVLIHYGASPFVSDEVISDAIRVCELHGNASPAHSQIYLASTSGDGESTGEFLNRDEVMCLNSPQALRFGYACWLYDEGKKRGLLNKVDPHTTSLMFALNQRVWFSKGSTANIKITTPEDLRLFKGWLLTEKDPETSMAAMNVFPA